MALKIAERSRVPPFIVMDVMRAANERAAGGHDVLHLEVGQPSTGAPKGVLDAVQQSLPGDPMGYTDALGLPALRTRIAEHYREAYGVALDPERVVACTGSSGAFVLAFLSAFEPGDRVALASPGYPAYRNILRALGVEPVPVLAGPETNFQPTPELLDGVAGPLHGLIVASPSNPTGTMVSKTELEALVAYCDERGVRLVSDEIYHGITFGKRAETALALTEDAIVVNSFSKYYSMTGWRIGWMVVPAAMLRPIECLTQNLYISPPTISQHAGIAAFDCGEELDAHVARYARNRALLLERLPEAGFRDMSAAEGAFYLYVDVAHLTNDSEAYCRQLLAETGIAMTPGTDFDPERGHRYLRISFAGATDVMAEAARRLGARKG